MQIDDAVKQVMRSVDDATPKFKKFGDLSLRLNAITDMISKVSDGFKSLLGTSLDFEQQQANLKTLLNGDAEATENLVNQIREYGKATVYDRGGLVESQKTMMAFGLDAEFAFGKLKNIGDIALGDSQKMQSLALAFSQATSSGKLMGQDLMQMINAGFNPLEVISQKTGKSMAQLKDEMSKGQISADMLAQSLEWATEEGGRFYKGAETAAETTAGKIAKMKDSIDEMKVSLFEATGGATAYIAEIGNMLTPLSALSPVFMWVGTSISFCKKNWGSFVNNVKKGTVTVHTRILSIIPSSILVGLSFGVMAVAAKKACRSIGVAIMNIPIVGWIAAAIAAIIAVVKLLWDKCEGFRRLVFGVWESLKAIFNNVWLVVSTVFKMIWTLVIKPQLTAFKSLFMGIWKASKWSFGKTMEAVSWMWNSIVNVATRIKDFFVGIWNAVSDAAKWCYDKIVGGLTWLHDKITGIISSIGGIVAEVWTFISETASTAIDWMVEKMGTVGGWIKEKIIQPVKDAFSNLWSHVKDIFSKMLDKLGKLFAPIRELWNKLFPKDQMKDISSAYREGAEKGSESFRRDQKEEEGGELKLGEATSVLGGESTGATTAADGKGNLTGGNIGSSAGMSAGKAQQITIKLSNMVGTMNFNGGLRDNVHDIETQLRELMARTLGMAETAH